MHIPLVHEHLFYKYFVRRSGYKKQICKKKCDERFLDFRYNFPNIFNIISKSFATYGCCHPCILLFAKNVFNSKIYKSVWLRTGSNPADDNRFQSHTWKLLSTLKKYSFSDEKYLSDDDCCYKPCWWSRIFENLYNLFRTIAFCFQFDVFLYVIHNKSNVSSTTVYFYENFFESNINPLLFSIQCIFIFNLQWIKWL